jgi:hypothetical protein
MLVPSVAPTGDCRELLLERENIVILPLGSCDKVEEDRAGG